MTVTNIVCIGGGTGLSTLLRGLKKYCTPTAVVTMADSGGHSGQLRDELGMLPPGDVRACLVALADDAQAPVLRDLFNYRFMNGSYSGANVGNLLLAALSDIHGDFHKAVESAHSLLGLQGRVLPVTLEPVDLLAELEDGTILFGEKAIDVPRKNGHLKIKRIWLQPVVTINPHVAHALQHADVILFGPGDLYTSLLPNLFVSGVREAIAASQARLVYVANIMTKHGETNGFGIRDYVQVLESHLPRPIDTVVYNTKEVPKRLVARYQTEHALPLVVAEPEAHWHGADVLSTAGNLARHDSEKLAAELMRVLLRKLEEVYA